MALVVCKKCGKKVSDSLDECFFCKNPLKNDLIVKKSNKTEKRVKFHSLPIEKTIELEKEFVNSDIKTIKYMQKSTAPKRFFTTFIITLIYFILFYSISLIFVEKLELIKVYNEELFVISLVCAFSAFALITFIIIIATVIRIFEEISINKYIYLKKFQTWLKDEKNILFSVDFLDSKEKEKFDQVDLKIMDL